MLQFHGQVSDSQRRGVIEEFRTSAKCRGLLLNYTTGGVGLNLQVASYVFLFDRWWNPAVEDQAVKRAHRIGAANKVFVRRFVCKATIEERIESVLAKKRRLFQDIIDKNRPHANMGMTEEELFSLFNMKASPRQKAEQKPPLKRLKSIDWRDFQQVVALVYEKNGYTVQVVGSGPDGGVDVVADRKRGTSRERVLVQCKHTAANVGRPVCQQLWGVMAEDQSVTSGAIFTSAAFSREASDFAIGKRLDLVDGKQLKEQCRQLGIAEFVDA